MSFITFSQNVAQLHLNRIDQTIDYSDNKISSKEIVQRTLPTCTLQQWQTLVNSEGGSYKKNPITVRLHFVCTCHWYIMIYFKDENCFGAFIECYCELHKCYMNLNRDVQTTCLIVNSKKKKMASMKSKVFGLRSDMIYVFGSSVRTATTNFDLNYILTQ